jgi:hypothetical protein
MSATNPTPTTPDTNDGRDARGRFAAGNTCGGGNPFARRVAGLRAALLETVTEQDVREIAYVLLLNAKAGDLPSIKLLFAYTLGKPQPFVNPDRLAIDEMQALCESAVAPEVVASLAQRLPVEFALGLARLSLDAAAANHGALLGEMLQSGAAADAPEETEAEPPDAAERARRRKAEAKARKRRRKEARRKMRERPSTNGGDGKQRPVKPHPAPSTTAATARTRAERS